MTRDQALGYIVRSARPSGGFCRRRSELCSQSDLMFGFAGGIAPRLSSAAVICKWFR